MEHQSCAGMINASALCGIEQEVKGEGVNAIAEISAELQKERQKNALLMERISLLEAQIQERDNANGICLNATKGYIRKFKRQKIETSDRNEDGKNINKNEMALKIKHERCMRSTGTNVEGRLVDWMSMDETQFSHFDKIKDGECAADCDDDDTDETENEDDDCYEEDETTENDENIGSTNKTKELLLEQSFHPSGQREPLGPHGSQVSNEGTIENRKPPDVEAVHNQGNPRKVNKEEVIKIGEGKAPEEIFISRKEVFGAESGSIPVNKKPAKVPFCPKEVKRILESDSLLLKNAQSHTIRKIIVFASLGIMHGCEDMYELDFNHFSILRKGEPYVSPKNPGEHVLYENPGVRRKVFSPNRQKPTLCPVQILEEEKAMRPSDPSCPSCLFLCIKYGGRTRNLPQNEYVRQRMGRNKLKSFGPLMCQMAMLVHVRSGSFFFKALGITLLFMAGFPNDLVQRETKHRNLDLLQKYYRTDDDAEREELFLPHQAVSDTASLRSQQLIAKTTSTKSKVMKQSKTTSKPQNMPRSSIQQPAPSTTMPPIQFGLMGYASIQANALAGFQSMPSQTHADTPVITGSDTRVSYPNQTPDHMFPPQATNTFMPMLYWPPPNAFPPGSYPAPYGYQSFPFPANANYISIYPQTYNNNLPSCSPFTPKVVEATAKNNNAALEESDSDSDSSSSSTYPKEAIASCK
ncbi:hypothetical protein AB3S75_008043 [Citrus x aurantiifolia]